MFVQASFLLLLSLHSISAFVNHPLDFFKSLHAVPSLRASGDAAIISQDTPMVLPDFCSSDEYLTYMKNVSKLPQGFAVGTADGTFVSVEAPGMGELVIRGTILYLTNGPTENWAAVFTQNKVRFPLAYFKKPIPCIQFPGAPIIVGRDRVAQGRPLHAIVINNKVSNVCSGGDGVADSERVCEAVAKALNLPVGAPSVLPSSTGVIGWRLPAEALADHVVPNAVKNLQEESALMAAKAICTTDRYPKVRSKTLSNGARIVGIAKGAGMIEPNMATMLSYIMTDATVSKNDLQDILSEVTKESFNSISVDGDESTSDTAVLVSSNLVDDVDQVEFRAGVKEVCQALAADLVRNGEGTGHVMRVVISNFPGTDHEARRLGRHIVNSPLFKCAVAGNDPNTGRLAGAIGSFMGKFKNSESVSGMSLKLGGSTIFQNGRFVLDGLEEELSKHMQDAQFDEHSDYPPHQRFVEIEVDFGQGGAGTAVVFGSDLTAEYVAVNADYRS